MKAHMISLYNVVATFSPVHLSRKFCLSVTKRL